MSELLRPVERLQFVEETLRALENRLIANAVNLDSSFERARVHLAEAVRRVDGAEERVLAAVPAVDFDEALGRLRQKGAATLSLAEMNLLVVSGQQVTANDLTVLVNHRPVLVRRLLRWCLVDWDRFRDLNDPHLVVKVIADHLDEVDVTLFSGHQPQIRTFLADGAIDGPELAATFMQASTLRDACVEVVDAFGLRASWSYTSYVLAGWIARHIATITDDDVRLLLEDATFARLLLPSSAATHGVVASEARVATPVRAHARAIGHLVDSGLRAQSRITPAVATALLERSINANTFRDPLSEPLSAGWQFVRQELPDAFKRIRSTLLTKDLEFFFAQAMNEPDRARFWKRYTTRLVRTICVLSRSKKEALEVRYGHNAESRMVLARARRFRHSSDVHAFCLVFPSVVVVEFSDTGNAAYVYERRAFETRFLAGIEAQSLYAASDLKSTSLALKRIFHGGPWEDKARDLLAEHGIHGVGT